MMSAYSVTQEKEGVNQKYYYIRFLKEKTVHIYTHTYKVLRKMKHNNWNWWKT